MKRFHCYVNFIPNIGTLLHWKKRERAGNQTIWVAESHVNPLNSIPRRKCILEWPGPQDSQPCAEDHVRGAADLSSHPKSWPPSLGRGLMTQGACVFLLGFAPGVSLLHPVPKLTSPGFLHFCFKWIIFNWSHKDTSLCQFEAARSFHPVFSILPYTMMLAFCLIYVVLETIQDEKGDYFLFQGQD